MSLAPEILKLADQCVKCGLCLPHCPTYRLEQDENESPRGRIALLQGLALGSLNAESHIHNHISQCLDCRNCERVCPAGVDYETLLNKGRQLLAEKTAPSPLQQKIKHSLIATPARGKRMRRLSRGLRFYQLSGIQHFFRVTGLLKVFRLSRLDGLLPKISKPANFLPHYPALGQEHGRVALFVGCLGQTLDQDTYRASIKVLTRLGYAVEVVKQQTCCGAIAMHNGAEHAAMELAAQNLSAFDPDTVDAIVYCATGCGAQLNQYPALFQTDNSRSARANALRAKLHEITSFLSRIEWPASLPFKPGSLTIASHTPCTQQNVLRQASHNAQLLEKIPGYRVIELAGNDQCCGAAGTYMLTQGDIADRLKQDKLAAISAAGADVVVTTNPGCGLFIGAGLSTIRVVHPVVLLADAIDDNR